MPELDSIRGIAILLVLLFHGMAPPSTVKLSSIGQFVFAASQFGWAGVNLFFVLSGFLITGILLDSRLNPNYYRRFYGRRVRRILPALYATLFSLLLAQMIGWKFFVLGALLLGNCGQFFAVALQYGPLWSLAVEEHFYLLWPAVVRRMSTRFLASALVAVVILTPVLRSINFARSAGPTDMNSLDTWLNLDGLAMGSLLAIWLRQPVFRRSQLNPIALSLMALGSVSFVLTLGTPLLTATLSQTACNVAAVGLLSFALLLATGGWSFLVNWRFLQFLGFISYGLYLLHVVAFTLVDVLFAHQISLRISSKAPTGAMLLRFLLGSGLAVMISYLSRRSLEEAFLRTKPEPVSEGPAQASQAQAA